MKKGELIKVTVEIALPEEATEEEAEAWLRFSFNDTGTIKSDNPLLQHAPEPWGTFGFNWEPTGEIGTEEKFNEVDHGDGRKSWSVRRKRERLA